MPFDEMQREPITIVELIQRRCSNRFGVAPCTASVNDGPRCYQTGGTCLDIANFNQNGVIRWRFVEQLQFSDYLYEQDGDNDISTNAIPCLVSVSHSASRINVGAIRKGESPLGILSGVSASFVDFPYDDDDGDFYRDQRDGFRGTFWAKMVARNPFFTGMRLAVYEGYRGQALSEMQKRVYIVEGINGPDAAGNVTVFGIDPLGLTRGKRAKFPRDTDMSLVDAITSSQTTGVRVRAPLLSDLSDAFGNTGTTRYVTIGNEILRYTGFTVFDAPAAVYTLSGVARGQLGTTAAAHSASAPVQRAGRYNAADAWVISRDLLEVHSGVPDEFIDFDQWEEEASDYLLGFQVEATISRPEDVETLLGELMQQCTFMIWWDDRAQKIPLKAIRPQIVNASISDSANIIAGSGSLTRDVESRITRLFVYYGHRDPTKGLDFANFANVRVGIDGTAEGLAGGGEVRSDTIFSRWLRTEGQAAELVTRILGRFSKVERYLSVSLDAKDRSIKLGDVVAVDTDLIADSEGRRQVIVWQVIRADEIASGHVVRYDLQEFAFQVARFARYMADDAPEWPGGDDVGAWYADEGGLMPDGSDGYFYQ